MARIPDADIERLKQEISLERLVEAQGIELKRHGADLLREGVRLIRAVGDFREGSSRL